MLVYKPYARDLVSGLRESYKQKKDGELGRNTEALIAWPDENGRSETLRGGDRARHGHELLGPEKNPEQAEEGRKAGDHIQAQQAGRGSDTRLRRRGNSDVAVPGGLVVQEVLGLRAGPPVFRGVGHRQVGQVPYSSGELRGRGVEEARGGHVYGCGV